jgi:hypothetical protein
VDQTLAPAENPLVDSFAPTPKILFGQDADRWFWFLIFDSQDHEIFFFRLITSLTSRVKVIQ